MLNTGVRGTALAWFASYVSGRYQAVVIDNLRSTPNPPSVRCTPGLCVGPSSVHTIFTAAFRCYLFP